MEEPLVVVVVVQVSVRLWLWPWKINIAELGTSSYRRNATRNSLLTLHHPELITQLAIVHVMLLACYLRQLFCVVPRYDSLKPLLRSGHNHGSEDHTKQELSSYSNIYCNVRIGHGRNLLMRVARSCQAHFQAPNEITMLEA